MPDVSLTDLTSDDLVAWRGETRLSVAAPAAGEWAFAAITDGPVTTRVLVHPDGAPDAARCRVATVESALPLSRNQDWALVATAIAWRLGQAGQRHAVASLHPDLVEPFEAAGWTTALRTMQKSVDAVDSRISDAGSALDAVVVRHLDDDQFDAFVDSLVDLHGRAAARVGLDLAGTFAPAYIASRRLGDDQFLGCFLDGRLVTRMWLTPQSVDGDGEAPGRLDVHVNAIDVPHDERGAGGLRPAIAALTEHFRERGLRRTLFRLYGGDRTLRGLMASQGYEVSSVTMTRNLT